MLWKVDLAGPASLQDQIAANVRRSVADGTLAAGERLPPARDLAVVLQVNANTVLAAYRRLRDEGLLEFRRGTGVRVRPNVTALASVTQRARELLELARRHGYTHLELADLLIDLGTES